MSNTFNVGDIIRTTRGRGTTHAIVLDIVHSALMYKLIYLHDGGEGVLGFKYAHRFYVVVSEGVS